MAYQIADDLSDSEGLLAARATRERCEELRAAAISRAARAIDGLIPLGEW